MFKIRHGKKKSRDSFGVSKFEKVKGNNSLQISLNNGTRLSFGNAQHQGRRPYQEDSCGYSDLSNEYLLNSKGVLAVLADGMGGLSNGKEVSNTVVSQMLEFFNSPDTNCFSGTHLFERAKYVNDAICRRFCPDGTIKAGSTLVCAMIHNGLLHWLCIGDSRVYLKRKGMLYQINEDHDYLNRLLGEAIDGRIDVREAFGDTQKDTLVSCFGNSELPEADYSLSGLALEKGDVIVLCSDGVYNAIPKETLNQLLETDPQDAAQNIEEVVLSQGFKTQDNLTVVVISFD